MSQSFKYKNNKYLDTKGIMHNRHLLSDVLYPIGSIYISVNSVSPSTLFGGTWTQITDRFLYCSTTSKTTGGSSTHTHTNSSTGGWNGTTGSTSITANQLPVSALVRENRTSGAGNTHWDSGLSGWGNYENGYGKSDRGQGHNHSIPNHSHTMSNTGSSSNIPPYFTVYCWYRTA